MLYSPEAFLYLKYAKPPALKRALTSELAESMLMSLSNDTCELSLVRARRKQKVAKNYFIGLKNFDCFNLVELNVSEGCD